MNVQKDDDRKAGDELVRRLLKTPPEHKADKGKRKVPPKVKPAKERE